MIFTWTKTANHVIIIEKQNLPWSKACSWGDDVCKLDHYRHDCMYRETPNVASHCRFCHSCEGRWSESTVHHLQPQTQRHLTPTPMKCVGDDTTLAEAQATLGKQKNIFCGMP